MRNIHKWLTALALALAPFAVQAAQSTAATYELNNKMGPVAFKYSLGTLLEQAGGIKPQVASSTTTLTKAQCGSTIVSNSADVVTLPEASTVLGCRYTFVCGTADDFDIDPNDGTDQISVVNSVAGGTGAAITPSAGDKIRCTDIGSSLTLEAVGADLWAAIGVGNGAWTDQN